MRTRPPTPRQLVTRAEIASLAGVRRPAVTNWQRRYPDFPRPDRSGDTEYFRLADVVAWLDSRSIPPKSRIAGESAGATYGDRVRHKLDMGASPTHATADVFASKGGVSADVSDDAEQQVLDELMGPLARRVRGSGAMADYLMLLLALNFLQGGESTLWSSVRQKAWYGSGQEEAKSLLQAIGHSADEALRRRGLLPGVHDAITRLEPRTFEDLKRLIGSAERLSAAAFGELLEQYEEHIGLRSDEFSTPPTAVELMVELALSDDSGVHAIYDPYARGGELLAAAAQKVRTENGPPRVAVHGENPRYEMLRLAGMNLALQGVDTRLSRGSRAPWDGTEGRCLKADVILANPPFNVGESMARERGEGRWPYGAPPVGNDNFAWIQYVLSSLNEGGRAAVVMPNSAGTSANQAERTIRQNMVESGAVECVIALPSQLFATTSIPVCVWLLRHPTGSREPVLFINARYLGTKKRGRRALTEEDQHIIIDLLCAWRDRHGTRRTSGTADGISGSADVDELCANGCSLDPADYVKAKRRVDRETAVLDPVVALDHLAELADQARKTDQAVDGLRHWSTGLDADAGDALPDGWVRVPLASVCEIQAGPSYSRLRADQRMGDGEVPIVLPKHLRDGRIDVGDRPETVSRERAAELKRFRLAMGDIVCVRSGSTGPSALVAEEQEGWVPTTNLLRLRAREPQATDPAYLLGYLALPRIMGWIKEHSAATAVPSISGQKLGQLAVVLPPIGEQRRIAAVLSTFDDQISVHQRLVRKAASTRTDIAELLMSGTLSLG
ncbi:hypothetical protein CDO52_01745 [Nocardiopsis gilva YIM 90087]|uniref:Uncharacterized protein n=1 Tax=Nocardiopsis gilva YIM 90087 TaxID=1235441 RepID=A0A223S0P0_9ACTN|nr:type I restriction-modification system subunit M/S [Nocardiopsis gilva]ASU81686.1 hypothetical protein CDO52_01745 [Nocardiopsis gilva YIM 90087]